MSPLPLAANCVRATGEASQAPGTTRRRWVFAADGRVCACGAVRGIKAPSGWEWEEKQPSKRYSRYLGSFSSPGRGAKSWTMMKMGTALLILMSSPGG